MLEFSTVLLTLSLYHPSTATPLEAIHSRLNNILKWISLEF